MDGKAGWRNGTLGAQPAELGPINVKVTVQGEAAQIVISAHQAVTRDALNDSLDHLRDALMEEGFTQVDVNVGHRGEYSQSGAAPDEDQSPDGDVSSGSRGPGAEAPGAGSPRPLRLTVPMLPNLGQGPALSEGALSHGGKLPGGWGCVTNPSPPRSNRVKKTSKSRWVPCEYT